MKDIDIYAPADMAIKSMNREILREFGKLKLAKFDEIHVVRNVTALYREQFVRAKKRYFDVAYEAYLLALYLCGLNGREAHKMAKKAITNDWVDTQLSNADPVTKYRFDTETERKSQRLIEALAADAENKNGTIGVGVQRLTTGTGTDAEIDKAIRLWSKQVGQCAISITDAAVMEAFDDANVPKVEWVSEKDQRVCHECKELDGQIFALYEIPNKPHWGCRCKLRPVF